MLKDHISSFPKVNKEEIIGSILNKIKLGPTPNESRVKMPEFFFIDEKLNKLRYYDFNEKLIVEKIVKFNSQIP